MAIDPIFDQYFEPMFVESVLELPPVHLKEDQLEILEVLVIWDFGFWVAMP